MLIWTVFAAVEMRDNPALRDIPVPLAGVVSEGRYQYRQLILRASLAYVARTSRHGAKAVPHLTLLRPL